MKSTYELRRFKTTSSPDFTRALKLYADNIEPALRTDTNEIIYWLDKYEEKYHDAFIILGLYLNEVLIGYAQLAYFKEEKFVHADYLVINPLYRKNNSFYEFLDKISTWLSDNRIVFNFIVCEVGCYGDNFEPTERSKALIRLLKMSQFGVIKGPYYIPQLGMHNYESQMRAILMIYTNDELKQLKKETFLLIINTLYFKYYNRWYEDFFTNDELKKYEAILIELFEKIKRDVSSKKFIEVNGYHNLLAMNVTELNEVKARKGIKIISFIAIFLVSVIVFGFITLFVKKRYNIDIDNQASILYLAVIIASMLISFLFGNKTNFATRLIEKLIDNL